MVVWVEDKFCLESEMNSNRIKVVCVVMFVMIMIGV